MGARYGRKVDKLTKDVVKLLRDNGCKVWSTNGTMDLVVGIPWNTEHELMLKTICIWEIKSDAKSPLKPSQVKFLKEWEEYNVYVIRSLDEAKRRIGV